MLAQKAGRDPDSWQDVREFCRWLEKEHWYRKPRTDARGWEPVRYVDNVGAIGISGMGLGAGPVSLN